MPYIIKKAKEGYKVCKKDEPKRCFSKQNLTEETAKKQRTAIILSELGLSRKRGGAGNTLPEEMPKTVAGIKETLIANGFDTHVFDLAQQRPAPKKADWETLYKDCQTEKKEAGPEPVGSFVSGPEEGFMKLTLRDNKGGSKKKNTK